MPKERRRNLELRGMIYRDQHGRPWEVVYDMRGMGTTGQKMPYRWDAPVIVPEIYIHDAPSKPMMLEINYHKWVTDLEERQREYNMECVLWARKLEKDKDSLAVKEYVGMAPYPADMVKACRAGNKWALGFVKDWRDRQPEWAKAYSNYWNPVVTRREEFEDVDDGTYEDLDTGPAPVAAGPLPDEKYGEYEDQFDPQGVGSQRQRTHKMGKQGAPKDG